MASVNQTRPHCVNQMGKTHSKPLAARHGRGTACYLWIGLKWYTSFVFKFCRQYVTFLPFLFETFYSLVLTTFCDSTSHEAPQSVIFSILPLPITQPLREKFSDTISLNSHPHIENQVRHPHKTGKCFNVSTMKTEATCSSPRNVHAHVPDYSPSHPAQ